MLARVTTFAIDGVRTRPITVEVDLHAGLPAFTIVGLGDLAVRESRERVRAAIQNSGFEFPQRRVTVNLAPANVRKQGPGFDLAIAIGVLAAAGEVPTEMLNRVAVYGELALGGELRAVRGTLAVSEGARDLTGGLIVPADSAAEAAHISGVSVYPAIDLGGVVAILRGEENVVQPPVQPRMARDLAGPDLGDVRGHQAAVAALEIAAAGGHSILLSGPPGTGKTMLARRLPALLPPMCESEAIEVTRIHSIAGLYSGGELMSERPFRAPHHTISASGLVGGGAVPAPGEATLAHLGVLFLDELAEFSRPALEAMRQPLEDGRVAIVRGQRSAVYPTLTTLVASTNPCPCGHLGEPRCRCGELDLARYRRKLSGPLLDRIDIRIEVRRPKAEEMRQGSPHDTDALRARVIEARERQSARLGEGGCNARMSIAQLRTTGRLDDQTESLLHRSYAQGRLSPRGHARVLRVARTIADLRGADHVGRADVLGAITLRSQDATPEEDVA